MRLFTFAPFLVALSCAQSPSHGDHRLGHNVDWSGLYHTGGSGYGASLKLDENGEFRFSASTCTAPAGRQHGKWSEEDGWILLSAPFPFIGVDEGIDRLMMVVEEEDQYLIPEGSRVSLLNQDWTPLSAGFVRGGFERRLELEHAEFLIYMEASGADMDDPSSWYPGMDNLSGASSKD